MLMSIPCRMASGIASLPEYLLMDASRISAEPIPAAEMGARHPKYLRMNGAPIKAVISRKMLASRAMVPSSTENVGQQSDGSQFCSQLHTDAGSFQLGYQYGRNGIIGKSAAHCHAVENTPLAEYESGNGRKKECSGYRSYGYQ